MRDAHASMLALLVAQAQAQGAEVATLKALVEEAATCGAERALGTLGLKDEKARRDMDEVRELLQAWRDAKKSAWAAVIAWGMRVVMALLVLGMSVRLGLWDVLK
jgi:hypothetical protein